MKRKTEKLKKGKPNTASKKEMPFWDHIFELRRRLFIFLLTVLVFSISSYIIYPHFFNLIHNIINEDLYAREILEGFMTRLKFSVILGLFLSIPVFLSQLVLFIYPALKRNEKIFFIITIFVTFTLFVAGIVFAYKYVMPVSMRFLKSSNFFPNYVKLQLTYQNFIKFFFQFLIGFGICFEFPVVLILLLKIGLIKQKFLIKNFKYFIIFIFVAAAILTPSTDVASQLMLALPMIILFLLTIVIAKIFRLGKD
jgi:sec-independent protein translocase protein TatC